MSIKKLALVAMASAALISTSAVAQNKNIVIGTGGQTGVYYQVGGAICRLVNKGTAKHHINCTHTTGGSITNINALTYG